MAVIRVKTESKWRWWVRVALRALSELTAMVVVGWVIYACWHVLRSMRP